MASADVVVQGEPVVAPAGAAVVGVRLAVVGRARLAGRVLENRFGRQRLIGDNWVADFHGFESRVSLLVSIAWRATGSFRVASIFFAGIELTWKRAKYWCEEDCWTNGSWS